ncbi:hypothetical protein [Flavisphingopyxis soli]|uniref:hypothetical protein n=1 Tax=Flavisphingopyxis soli TaxID=2601267 RepID=UPI0013758BC2|nr:hypothetical protein [Sphingorhabdus soli]
MGERFIIRKADIDRMFESNITAMSDLRGLDGDMLKVVGAHYDLDTGALEFIGRQ